MCTRFVSLTNIAVEFCLNFLEHSEERHYLVISLACLSPDRLQAILLVAHWCSFMELGQPW